MAFSAIWRTSAANSSGLAEPGREGDLPAEARLRLGGRPSSIGVRNSPGAIATTRMPALARSRAIGRVIAATAPLEAA